jgi:hypothetical protein
MRGRSIVATKENVFFSVIENKAKANVSVQKIPPENHHYMALCVST